MPTLYTKGQFIPGSTTDTAFTFGQINPVMAGARIPGVTIIHFQNQNGSQTHTYTIPGGTTMLGDLVILFGGGAYMPTSGSPGFTTQVTITDATASLRCGLFSLFCGAVQPTTVTINYETNNAGNNSSVLMVLRGVNTIGNAKGSSNGASQDMSPLSFNSPFTGTAGVPMSLVFVHSTTHPNFTIVPTPIEDVYSVVGGGGRFNHIWRCVPPANGIYSATPIASSAHKCGVVAHFTYL